MKRQLISSALALSLIFGGAAALPESFAPQSSIVAQAKSIRSGDYKYSLLKDGTAKIVKYKGKDTDVKIPSKIDGKKVTMIAKNAFSENETIKNVTIPKGVTKIGDYAFSNCTSLKSVTIPNSVKKIGYSAFSYCTSLKSVTIPNSVKTIDSFAFYCCENLKTIKIPSSVKSIGDYTFVGTKWRENTLKKKHTVIINGILIEGMVSGGKATIPNSVTMIGESAFSDPLLGYGYFGLKSVTIPKSVKEIGANAFWNCADLKDVKIKKGVKKIGAAVFQYCQSLKTITIPNSVKELGESAFDGCLRLKSVTIPKSVKTIGKDAFANCHKNLVIKTPKGSAAAKYAKKNGIKVKYI